ncbi:MAG: YciI family protein [Chloroflexi bacterium]|nr:YciI family protein [Chloroflexota bacterium]
MTKFVVTYHAPVAAFDQMKDATPEDMAEGMKAWMAWAEKCGDGLVDMGTPLAGGQKMTRSGATPSDRGVAGYSILQAENMDAAKALLEGHPHLEWAPGCEIEVHESMPMPS